METPLSASANAPTTNANPGTGDGTLRVIAAFKVFEGLVLVIAGCGALGLLNPDLHDAVVDGLQGLSLHTGREFSSALASRGAALLGDTSVERLALVAAGCFVYAAVFLVEATGLWLRKRWAEYLTTIVTASLLPFEIMELVHRASLAKGATLIVNGLVVAYLVVRLRSQRDAKKPATD